MTFLEKSNNCFEVLRELHYSLELIVIAVISFGMYVCLRARGTLVLRMLQDQNTALFVSTFVHSHL
jgi:hypothetical protein